MGFPFSTTKIYSLLAGEQKAAELWRILPRDVALSSNMAPDRGSKMILMPSNSCYVSGREGRTEQLFANEFWFSALNH